jgi:hypothetical protein
MKLLHQATPDVMLALENQALRREKTQLQDERQRADELLAGGAFHLLTTQFAYVGQVAIHQCLDQGFQDRLHLKRFAFAPFPKPPGRLLVQPEGELRLAAATGGHRHHASMCSHVRAPRQAVRHVSPSLAYFSIAHASVDSAMLARAMA